MHREFKTVTIGEQDSGRRIDRVIRKFLPDLPLALIYKALRTGQITVNGKKIKNSVRTLQNDVLNIEKNLMEQGGGRQNTVVQESTQRPLVFPYEILFKNEHLLVINKPYNTLSQGKAHKVPCVGFDLAEYRKSCPEEPQSLSFTPAPLHRLDRKTSGILVCSQSLAGARRFSTLLHDHLTVKQYLGIVSGTLLHKAEWIDCIEKIASPNKDGFYTVTGAATGKEAITQAVPLCTGSFDTQPVTLVKFTIITGRTHQIRSQCALHGFPLLGDSAYEYCRRILPARDFFLHAHTLSVPSGNEAFLPQTIIAPPGSDFIEMCKRCLLETEFTPYNS